MVFAIFTPVASAQDALKINDGESMGTVTAGYFGLQWGENAEEGGVWKLERARSESFESPIVIYNGPDHGTFESGLSNGTYYYRLIREGQTGPVYRVDVRHHSLNRAILFLGTGAIVFLALLFVLLRADRASAESGTPVASSTSKREED